MNIADSSSQDRPLRASIRRKRRWFIVLCCGFLSGATLYVMTSFAPGFTVGGTLQSENLRLSRVIRGELVREIIAQGKVVVANSPTLFSPENGFVHLYVKAGDEVTKGQRLAKISSPELGEQLARQKSELTRIQADLERQKIQFQQLRLQQEQAQAMAEVQLKAMKREVRRANESYKLHIISQLDYEKARDDLARAQLEFDQATQVLALSNDSLEFYDRSLDLQSNSQTLIIKALQRRIDAMEIVSPVDGMIGNVQVNDRQAVSASQPLISVVDMSAYEVEASVPEGVAGELNPGLGVKIRLAGQRYEGMLAAVSPEVVNGSVTARIRFSEEAPSQLRQNQRLTAHIQLENKPNSLMVERGPFFDTFQGYVYKVRDNRARKTPVTLGSRSLRYIEVLDGLAEKDTVIVSSLDKINPADDLLINL